MVYNLSFNNWDINGTPMYNVTDENGLDPIGEVIYLDDMFLNGHRLVIDEKKEKADFVSIILPLLDKPNLKDADLVLKDVFKNYKNFNNIVDCLDTFEESVFFSVKELGL